MSCSLIPLLIGIGSAILGGLIGWFRHRNRRYNPLKALHDEKETALTQLNHAYSAINTRFSSLQNEHVNLQKTNADWINKYNQLNTDFDALGASRSTLLNDYNAVKNAHAQKTAECEAAIKKLNAENEMILAQADNKYALLSIDYSNAVTQAKILTATVGNMSSEKEIMSSEYGNYRSESNQRYNELHTNYEKLQKNYDVLAEENENIKKQLPDSTNRINKTR